MTAGSACASPLESDGLRHQVARVPSAFLSTLLIGTLSCTRRSSGAGGRAGAPDTDALARCSVNTTCPAGCSLASTRPTARHPLVRGKSVVNGHARSTLPRLRLPEPITRRTSFLRGCRCAEGSHATEGQTGQQTRRERRLIESLPARHAWPSRVRFERLSSKRTIADTFLDTHSAFNGTSTSSAVPVSVPARPRGAGVQHTVQRPLAAESNARVTTAVRPRNGLREKLVPVNVSL